MPAIHLVKLFSQICIFSSSAIHVHAGWTYFPHFPWNLPSPRRLLFQTLSVFLLRISVSELPTPHIAPLRYTKMSLCLTKTHPCTFAALSFSVPPSIPQSSRPPFISLAVVSQLIPLYCYKHWHFLHLICFCPTLVCLPPSTYAQRKLGAFVALSRVPHQWPYSPSPAITAVSSLYNEVVLKISGATLVY